MLYEVASPLFTLAGLTVLLGVAYSVKCFFDNRMAKLEKENHSTTSAAEA